MKKSIFFSLRFPDSEQTWEGTKWKIIDWTSWKINRNRPSIFPKAPLYPKALLQRQLFRRLLVDNMKRSFFRGKTCPELLNSFLCLIRSSRVSQARPWSSEPTTMSTHPINAKTTKVRLSESFLSVTLNFAVGTEKRPSKAEWGKRGLRRSRSSSATTTTKILFRINALETLIKPHFRGPVGHLFSA